MSDPRALIESIVAYAGTLRNDQYENVSDGAWIAVELAEDCDALRTWVTERRGYLPGDTMPWDGGNDLAVRNLIAEVYRQAGEENVARVFAAGIRLADLVTMVNLDHLV